MASFTQTLRAAPAAVGQARRMAAAFARDHGASDEVAADVALAVSEAATNAVRHSGADELRLELSAAEGELCVRVVDRGVGLGEDARDPGSGLGLVILAQLCSRVELREPASGGTDVSMAFALHGQPRAPVA